MWFAWWAALAAGAVGTVGAAGAVGTVGAVVGLRQTGQRLSSILIPPVMGAVADHFGTSHSFLIYAAFMLQLCGLLALIIRIIAMTTAIIITDR